MKNLPKSGEGVVGNSNVIKHSDNFFNLSQNGSNSENPKVDTEHQKLVSGFLNLAENIQEGIFIVSAG
ncbi:MAG: hypothetical protein WCP08_09500, partial [Prolixibacteraceae bacterium]